MSTGAISVAGIRPTLRRRRDGSHSKPVHGSITLSLRIMWIKLVSQVRSRKIDWLWRGPSNVRVLTNSKSVGQKGKIVRLKGAPGAPRAERDGRSPRFDVA